MHTSILKLVYSNNELLHVSANHVTIVREVKYKVFFSAVALRPNAGHGLLTLEVSRSHTTTHHSR